MEVQKPQKERAGQSHSWHVSPSWPFPCLLPGQKELGFLSSLLNSVMGKLGPRRASSLAKATRQRMERERCSSNCVTDLRTSGRHSSYFPTLPIAQLQNFTQQPWQSLKEERKCPLPPPHTKEFRIIPTQGYKAERTPGSEGQDYAKMPSVP